MNTNIFGFSVTSINVPSRGCRDLVTVKPKRAFIRTAHTFPVGGHVRAVIWDLMGLIKRVVAWRQAAITDCLSKMIVCGRRGTTKSGTKQTISASWAPTDAIISVANEQNAIKIEQDENSSKHEQSPSREQLKLKRLGGKQKLTSYI